MRRVLRTTAVASWILTLATAGSAGAAAAGAADGAGHAVSWGATDTSGAAVTVPAAGRVSVIVFVRPDQPQSRQAIEQIAAALADASTAQIVAVVSGPDAADKAKALVGNGTRSWPIVVDTDYAASGKLGVHAWPTTLVVAGDGRRVAHLPGLTKSFAADLSAHLAFAAGEIDRAALDQRLATRPVVGGDSPEQAAARHAQVAERSLAKGQVDVARAEVEAGLARAPDNVNLRLMKVRVMLAAGDIESALAALDALPPNDVPPWQVALLHGKAYIAADRWGDAKAALPAALKLNPHPAEAHYLIGLVHEHEQDWPKAAESFKRACESSGLRGR